MGTEGEEQGEQGCELHALNQVSVLTLAPTSSPGVFPHPS